MDISRDKQMKSRTKRLSKGNLKRETASLLKTAQNNAIRTNYVELPVV